MRRKIKCIGFFLPNIHSNRQRLNSDSYTYEAGRRFHNNQHVPYLQSNDMEVMDRWVNRACRQLVEIACLSGVAPHSSRLDAKHYAMQYLFNGNYVAKLNEPQKILDIDTGTGTW